MSAKQQILALTGADAFTILAFDLAAFEAERVYSSALENFSNAGRKPLQGAAWFEVPFRKHACLISVGAEQISRNHKDHAHIATSGITAVVNIPVIQGETCIASLNCLYRAAPQGNDFDSLIPVISRLAQSLIARD